MEAGNIIHLREAYTHLPVCCCGQAELLVGAPLAFQQEPKASADSLVFPFWHLLEPDALVTLHRLLTPVCPGWR